MDLQKMQGSTFVHLGPDVRVIDRKMMAHHMRQISKETVVQIDPTTTPLALVHLMEDAGIQIYESQDPCVPLKAIKNEIEIQGMRRCHIRDGAALTRFLAWLDRSFGTEEITEISASNKLEEFRKEGLFFMGLSFDTISAMGPHGAIVHYRATPESDSPLSQGIYLLDSGAQYLDGTTDVTRTIALGTPTQEQKENFTRVLKGHIALASAKFPEGTTGAQLDVLARLALWKEGLDYDHGTGHGVGSYLNVHEGPQSISKASRDVPLQPGMILSNEPGYYKTNAYGIRIESLVVVKSEPTLSEQKPFYGFETITCAPIDRNLIISEMLTASEKDWLNSYHTWVYETLLEFMDASESAWLKSVTEAL
ncbi:Creatinase/Prolidase, APP and Peptidase_M24_C domain-containing protein [Candidatus Bealeia paramacronuclearis]|uniref:Creatinase/Prolidase, APP and Peptidase_M24_C domain-containing protein n=2 Tax=Candidatus Bealeia paramacronuclearis TaxID=1921001 RepID=A0ABZ2C5P5_9PROT|nr:Creatinase/Prolidase, APP and Peptidase_M24_C domain-containing protein [Candidatus Bealeia paramacronuclearis]